MPTYYIENVLCDYSCGLIVVNALNKKTAIELIAKTLNDYSYYSDLIKDLEELKILEKNKVVYVYGGG